MRMWDDGADGADGRPTPLYADEKKLWGDGSPFLGGAALDRLRHLGFAEGLIDFTRYE